MYKGEAQGEDYVLLPYVTNHVQDTVTESLDILGSFRFPKITLCLSVKHREGGPYDYQLTDILRITYRDRSPVVYTSYDASHELDRCEDFTGGLSCGASTGQPRVRGMAIS